MGKEIKKVKKHHVRCSYDTIASEEAKYGLSMHLYCTHLSPKEVEQILSVAQGKENKSEQGHGLKIGQKVRVVPEWTNKDKPKPKEKRMYVRELKKGNCAGLSHTKDSEHIYGILYSIIKPIK